MSQDRAAPDARPCPSCGKPLGAYRGVCPDCGHMTTWFQLRLLLGCGGMIFALLAVLLMLVLRMLGIA